MTKYENILENQAPCQHCVIALETQVTRVFSKQVELLLKENGYQVKGMVNLSQDFTSPYLWHIQDCTPEKSVNLDFIFNAKTEQLTKTTEVLP